MLQAALVLLSSRQSLEHKAQAPHPIQAPLSCNTKHERSVGIGLGGRAWRSLRHREPVLFLHPAVQHLVWRNVSVYAGLAILRQPAKQTDSMAQLVENKIILLFNYFVFRWLSSGPKLLLPYGGATPAIGCCWSSVYCTGWIWLIGGQVGNLTHTHTHTHTRITHRLNTAVPQPGTEWNSSIQLLLTGVGDYQHQWFRGGACTYLWLGVG